MKRVKGNKLVLDIALQKVQLVSGEKETTDFLLTSSDVVKVRFVGNTTKDVVPEISISTIKVVDNGTLPCGSYGVEVLITTADGDNYRYYDSDLFTIVERTSDADIVGNAEFDDESSISLGASVYEAASGSTTTSGLTTAQVQALLTPYAKDADLARVAKSGSYTDLEDKPTIPSAYDDTEIKAQIASKQDASSAFDGDYNSLTNKPTIPTMPSDYLTSDDLQGYATTEALSGKVDKVSGKGLSSNDYTDEDKEKLASLENNNVDLSNYATKSDLDAKQNKLTDRILLRVNGQHDDTLTIYGGVYSSSFGNNIGGYNMYFNKSGMYINNKQVATQEWVNENCDTSSLEERVDALEAIDHTQYLTEHQSLAGYAKSADVAKDYQPKGNYLTAHQDISGKADKEQVVTPTSGTATIEPNKFYKFGTTETLDISLAEPTDTAHTNHYHFSFTATDSTTLVMPYDVIWQGGVEPKRTSGNVYEVSILDNCASFMEFTPYDD